MIAIADVRARLRRELADVATAAWKSRAELLVTGALLVGWLLITAAIAELTAAVAWKFSIGLLLLLGCGWRLVWRLFSDGLYDLTRERKPQ